MPTRSRSPVSQVSLLCCCTTWFVCISMTQAAEGALVLSSETRRSEDYYWRTVGGPWHRGLTSPSQNLHQQHVSYCGGAVPHDFTSMGDTASVAFVSDSTNTATGVLGRIVLVKFLYNF